MDSSGGLEQMHIKNCPQGNCLGRGQHAVGGEGLGSLERETKTFTIRKQEETVPTSLQLRVLRLRLLQDGNIGVGVFPEGEENLARQCTLDKVTTSSLSTLDL